MRESPVWISIRYFLFRLTCWLCARLDRNGTTRSRMDPLQLCGSSLWRKMKVKKENLSLFPIGPVYAVIFVNDSAIMNQTDGHWTMTGSVKIIIMKILHSLDTATILAFDLDFMRSRDDLCLIVNEVRKKNSIIHYPCSGFCCTQHAFSESLVFRKLSDSLIFCFSSQSPIFVVQLEMTKSCSILV